MKKGSFILYDVDLESVAYLSDAQAGKLFKALQKFRSDGTLPDFGDDAALQIVFHQIREHIAINEEKYKAVCEKNRQKAKSRWAKNDSDDKKNYAGACSSIPVHAGACLYDNDTDNDNGTVNDTGTDNDACGSKKENKRKNYYNKKNNVPALLRDEPSYDADAFMRKAIGIKYQKVERSP